MNPFKIKKGLGRGLSSLIGDTEITSHKVSFLSARSLEININLEKFLIKKA